MAMLQTPRSAGEDLSDQPPQSPVPLAERAYLVLRDKLVMLDIRPGEPINDLTLANELGIGRTPIREALKRLETDHLVVAFPRRGTFATGVDVTELGAISDLRLQLEPHAARRAAENATPTERDELRAAAEQVRELSPTAGDSVQLIRTDVAVHRLVYGATGNRHLQDVLIRYDNLATRIWCLVADKLPALADHVHEHRRILVAIADGEPDLAAALTAEHVTGFDRAVRRLL